MKTFLRLTLFFIPLLLGCATSHLKRENILPESFLKSSRSEIEGIKIQSPFLKAHMKNGNLYVFVSWQTDETKKTISGMANLFNANRELIENNHYKMNIDSIALLETNVITNSGAGTALTVFTGITAAVTAFCISNPKSCFGSCPTFYVSDGDSLRLQAEGFSSSITPSLEATDIDALYYAKPNDGELLVEMKNEALETHVVRYVDILSVPKEKNYRVFTDQDGQFWTSSTLIRPISAIATEGDCLPLLLNVDGKERFSLADNLYLGKKEEINLKFEIQAGKSYGLVVGTRQTLLPTYLLYQALAYMGNDAGHWLAEIERNNFSNNQGVIEKMIGGIEVFLYSPKEEWTSMGTIDEHGPLASDIHLISLGKISTTKCNLKIRMTQGTWRIDYIALAELTNPVKPIRIHPYKVLRDGQEDSDALSILLDSTKVLVTLPGDSYKLKYKLPDKQLRYEFFLQSRGYYLEWIRKEWIEEENQIFLAEMFFFPERSLMRLAPEFKRVESQLEDCFWRSRYAKP